MPPAWVVSLVVGGMAIAFYLPVYLPFAWLASRSCATRHAEGRNATWMPAAWLALGLSTPLALVMMVAGGPLGVLFGLLAATFTVPIWLGAPFLMKHRLDRIAA
jgi:hypothetical protein